MGLEDRLNYVLNRQFALVHVLHRVKADIVSARTRLELRIAELDRQQQHATEQYEQAVAERDPQAGLIREWPQRTAARLEELRRLLPEMDIAEGLVQDRIHRAEQDLEDYRLLQPLLVSRVAAARSAGVGREVFETLNDALSYVELALDTAEVEDPNGPPRRQPPRTGPIDTDGIDIDGPAEEDDGGGADDGGGGGEGDVAGAPTDEDEDEDEGENEGEGQAGEHNPDKAP